MEEFEKEWREVLENASKEPPKIIWSEIRNSLTSKSLATAQRQKGFYKVGIAAAILLAGFFGFSLYTAQKSGKALRETAYKTPPLNGMVSALDFSSSGSQEKEHAKGMPLTDKKSDTEGLTLHGEANKDRIRYEPFSSAHAYTTMPLHVDFGKVKDHLYGLPETSIAYGVPSKKKNNTFWAGISLESATFNPNFKGGKTNLSNSLTVKNDQFSPTGFTTQKPNSEAPPVREKMIPGTSFGLGMALGMRLNSRWGLQSGIQYSRATATNSTNLVVETRKTVNPIPATSQYGRVAQVQDILNAEEVVTYQYKDVDLNNQFHFASIPLKAMYKVVDQRLSIGLNAGVATTIYLGNKLTDPSQQLAEVTLGPGDNSPYRHVNFVGLAGIQLEYQILRHFDVTIEPNYSYSINSLTKESAGFITNPTGLGVQTGIKYRFE